MARQGELETTEQPTLAAVMATMAEVLAKVHANTPVKVLSFDSPEYQERLRAEGVFDTLAVPVYQNGREVEPRGLRPETRERVVQLQPGRYLKNAVEVVVDAKGRRHLYYKSATPEDRMRFMSVAADFDDLIAKIWAEQPA
jgi:hypothetical protein